ncbi:MAG: hypothetical protein GX887_04950 [Firmicutes bacterium]|nr:hypothetical protein [Bacillota bacterium]
MANLCPLFGGDTLELNLEEMVDEKPIGVNLTKLFETFRRRRNGLGEYKD